QLDARSDHPRLGPARCRRCRCGPAGPRMVRHSDYRVSARGKEQDKVIALDAGADDYPRLSAARRLRRRIESTAAPVKPAAAAVAVGTAPTPVTSTTMRSPPASRREPSA